MREILPPGSGKAIAKAAGVSEKTVSRFFNAKSDHHQVKVLVLKMLNTIESEDVLLEQKVENIVARLQVRK